MNRNPDGTILSADDLRQIARDNGVTDEQLSSIQTLHNDALIMSALSVITADARLALFFAGKLVLGTRVDFVPKDPPSIDADAMTIFQALKRT